MSQCNCCHILTFKTEAKKKKQKATVIPTNPNSPYYMGGFEVYVHPKTVKIKDLSVKQSKKYWVAWMMEISERCCC